MTALSPAKAAKHTKRAKVSASSGPSRSPNGRTLDRRTLVFCLALIAAVLVSYSSVIHNGFLDYDNELYITDNPHVKAGISAAIGRRQLEDYSFPANPIFHALDYRAFRELNPANTSGR